MGKRSREKRERRLKGEIREIREEPIFGLETILKKIIFFGTCLILFTPLIISSKFFFPFVGPKSLYFMGLTEVIFFVWFFLIIFYPKYRPRFNLLLLALILFLIIFILASILGIDPFYSFWSKFERMTGTLMLLHLFAFFLVIFSTFKKEEWLKFFLVSIFVGVILSFIALVSKDPNMRGGATIGNESFLGTYLLFNLFLGLYLIFKTKGGLRLYSLICFLIMVLEVFLSGARAVKISFLGGLFLLTLLYLIFLSKKRYLNLIGKTLLIFSLLAFLLIIILVFKEGSIVQQKFIQLATKARLVVWQNAWQLFLERPLLGFGPENFDIVFPKYFNPCMFLPECGGEIWFDKAHNIIFDTLVSVGIFGFLGYLLIFFSVFYILWKLYFQRNIEFWTSAIFSTMLVSYFVQNLTVFDMVSSYMMFFLILGFVASIASVPSIGFFNQEKNNLKKQLVGILILIIFIFSFNKFIIQPFKTDYYVINVFKSQNPKERVFWGKKALNSSPVARYQIREHFVNFAMEFFKSQKAKQFSKEDYKLEFEFISQELERSIKESPLNYRTYLYLGQVYNLYALIDPSKISRTEEVLKKTIELSPTNQQGYWALAQTKLYQAKFQEALLLAEKALELEKRVPKSHLIVVQVAKFSGDKELTKKKAEEAIKIIPNLEPEIKKILEG